MRVFLTGATGYLGRPLAERLISRGHQVRALVRPASRTKLPSAIDDVIEGDPLEAASFAPSIAPCDTLVHLVGTPHPNPSKAREFREVDLASIRASARAAATAGTVRHLVYVSVAHPAPVMRAYIDARMEGERLVRETGIGATIIRPWYVLGPGHWWPYSLVPLYAVLRAIPATREGATRLGLVTRRQMLAALLDSVQNPPGTGEVRVLNVPDIRRL
jgi:uncharacterized protein YbjT (DUF2867 family)